MYLGASPLDHLEECVKNRTVEIHLVALWVMTLGCWVAVFLASTAVK